MNKPKISIIIPVYNAENYLRQCLDSIQAQTLKEIEMICINDGSTDSSLSILKEYSLSDKRIKVVSKKNDGLGSARNTGLNLAEGEYIGFVDSDDFVEMDFFLKLYNRAIDTDAEVVIGNISLYYDDSKTFKPYRDKTMYSYLSTLKSFNAKEIPWILENIGIWDRIYKRKFLESFEIRNPEHIIYEDALFSYQTSILAKRLTVVDDVYYIYRKNIGTAITDKEIENDNYKFDFLANCLSIRKFLLSQNEYKVFQKNYNSYFLKNALWHQSNIMVYQVFKRFYEEARRMLTQDDLLCIRHSKALTWKSRFYAVLLSVNCPFICYSMFFYKRKKRKRGIWYE